MVRIFDGSFKEHGYVDLHLHTYFSDGKYSPVELIELAKKRNLSAISITDHDNIEAHFELEKIKSDFEVVPGIEMSSDFKGTEVHILGYYFDIHNKNFNETIVYAKDGRKIRAEKIISKLQQLGYDIEFSELAEITNHKYYSRPDIAALCVKKNITKNIQEAFENFLNIGCPAYVPRISLTPEEMIKTIHNADGLAVWAHPKFSGSDTSIIKYLVDCGIDGIEAYHSLHNKDEIKKYTQMAEEYNLLITGGSDYHGVEGIAPEIWDYKLPYEYLQKLARSLTY